VKEKAKKVKTVKRGEGEKEWYNVSKKSGWGFW
jgi:hypothetical protein